MDYKKLLTNGWVVSIAALGGLATVVLNAPDFLRSVRELPNEIGLTLSQMQSWLYEDDDWKGQWTDTQEYVIGVSDLTSTGMVIALDVEHGVIDGTISYKGICDLMPFWDTLSLSGETSFFGGSATVVAWDFVNGEKATVASLELERDDGTMTVKPVRGYTEIFPATARLMPLDLEPNAQSNPSEHLCPEMKKRIQRAPNADE